MGVTETSISFNKYPSRRIKILDNFPCSTNLWGLVVEKSFGKSSKFTEPSQNYIRSWSNVEKLFRVFYSPFETNLHSYRTEIFSFYDSSRSDENSTIFIYIFDPDNHDPVKSWLEISQRYERIVHLHSRDVEISFRAIQFRATHET